MATNVSAPPSSAQAGDDSHIIGEEYEHTPVPPGARLSLGANITVWIGFPMIITGAITGSLLVLGMGFSKALTAMVIGNVFMFLYVGLMGQIGARTGRSYALIASGVFGKKGYVFSSGLLATLLLGWYAVQTGITAALVNAGYGFNYTFMAIIAGLLYIGITAIGVRGLHIIGMISVPLFVILGLWVLFESANTAGWDKVIAYQGNNGVATMSMGVGLTIVVALFIDAGTVSADFNRWAKNSRDSWIQTFFAFPFANLIAMLVGGVMTAALAVPNANPFGADNMFGYLHGKGIAFVSFIAFIFLFVNLGSVCSHCLYNTATGWARILHTKMRLMALLLGIVGIIIAAANVWQLFPQWLSLLGVLVPPIGGIVLVDQYILKGDLEQRVDDWHPLAFLAWIIGSVIGLIVEFKAPQWSTALSAFVVAAIAYWIIAQVAGNRHRAA